jgi:phenylacetate-CoA ligase
MSTTLEGPALAKPDGTFWNRAKETAARSDRERYILDALQKQLRYVYAEVPFYRALYDAKNFKPSEVKSLEDYTRLVPIVKKSALLEDQLAHQPFGSYLGVPPDTLARIHGSSGTTGKPTLYGISRKDWNYTAGIMAQAFYMLGVRPDDRVQLATLFSLFLGGWGALLACETIGATVFPIGAGETERQLELMYRVGSTVLICTPTYALHMLEVGRSLGYDTKNSPLRLGIFLGEPGSGIPGTRRTLEEGWGIKVRDTGSTSEMTPWATNAECSEGAGMHLINDEIWTEIVDKNDANVPVPEGTSGAVIYSHLRRESQPMMRFYSGDESQMTYAPCKCGRTYPRLPYGVYGRLDDMLIIRGTNVYPSQVQRSLLEVPGTGVEFVIVMERNGAMDEATVRVEHDPTHKPDDFDSFAKDLHDRVRAKLKSDTSVNFKVEILPPNTLERAISKAKRVDDRRPKYRPE